MNKPEVMIPGSFSKLDNGRIIDPSTVEFLEGHAEMFARFEIDN